MECLVQKSSILPLLWSSPNLLATEIWEAKYIARAITCRKQLAVYTHILVAVTGTEAVNKFFILIDLHSIISVDLPEGNADIIRRLRLPSAYASLGDFPLEKARSGWLFIYQSTHTWRDTVSCTWRWPGMLNPSAFLIISEVIHAAKRSRGKNMLQANTTSILRSFSIVENTLTRVANFPSFLKRTGISWPKYAQRDAKLMDLFSYIPDNVSI